MSAFGIELARLMEARGTRVRQLARAVPCNAGHISNLRSGRDRPSAKMAARLDDMLGAGGTLRALVPGAPGQEHEARAAVSRDTWRAALAWLVDDPPRLAHARTGHRIGSGLVADIESRVHGLRLLDDQLGGADTLRAAEDELRSTEQVIEQGTYDEATGRRLLTALADLYQIAGWIASDAGRYAHAERLYLDGVRAACTAADDVTAAGLLSTLAYQVANTGSPPDAVLLAKAAVRGAAGTDGRPRALLLDRLAWAAAKAGDAVAADRALEEADEAYAARADGEPQWTYWLTRGEMDIMRARCMTELRRPLRAVPLLESILASYPGDRARETALYRTWLAQAYAQANEMDAAREAYDQAAALAGEIRSERLHARLRSLEGIVAR